MENLKVYSLITFKNLLRLSQYFEMCVVTVTKPENSRNIEVYALQIEWQMKHPQMSLSFSWLEFYTDCLGLGKIFFM